MLRMTWLSRELVLAGFCWLVSSQAGTALGESSRPDLPKPEQLILKVISGGEAIRLDGVLDEEAWQRADVAATFWQHAPLDRMPATERTEVRVVQDEHALYFGILCFDSEPDKIVNHDMRRDAPLSNDDYLGLYLDTFHDHRNFYYFSTNPLGTRRDGIVTDARSYNTAWNGIWQARAVRTDQGWSAEYRIPFSTLRFGGEQPMTWGFNIGRAIRRKQESVHWAPIPRELGRNGTWRGEFFGQLVGIRTNERVSRWEVEPYLLAGGEKSYRPDGSESRFNAGGDVRFDVTPSLRADLSLRTDFAQVEADQEVVNFTRFPLFFPEKREFFLENGGLFSVGFEEEAMMFYSRRIGLSEGQEVPILMAGKLSGKAGPYSLGLMNVQTGSSDLQLNGENEPEPAANFTTLRVKRNLFSNSTFGAVLTNRQSAGDFSRLGGVDGNFWFSPALKGEMLLAGTFNPSGQGNDTLGIGRMIFASHDITGDLRYYAIGPEFVPEMGFVLENDLKRVSGQGGYTYWISRRGIRNLQYTGTLVYDSFYGGGFHGRRAAAGVKATLESNDILGYAYTSADERILEAFTVGPLIVSPGDYPNRAHNLTLESNAVRPVSVKADWGIMDYWGGERRQLLLSGNFHPTPNLSVDAIYSYNTVDHPGNKFSATTLSNRVLYAFTTDLFVKSFVQWNDLEKRLSMNFLMGWEYRPGSDIYLVYDELQDQFERPDLAVRDRLLLVKWSYNFRF